MPKQKLTADEYKKMAGDAFRLAEAFHDASQVLLKRDAPWRQPIANGPVGAMSIDPKDIHKEAPQVALAAFSRFEGTIRRETSWL